MRNLRFALILVVLFLLPGLATPLFAQWGPARIIKCAPDTFITLPYYNEHKIATDPFGRVHVVWAQLPIDTSGGQPTWVYYMRSTDWGQTWEFPIQLNQPVRSVGDGPSVAADGVGNVHVVWSEMFSGGGYGAIYRRSTDGGQTWEPETVLVYNSKSFPDLPQIVSDRKSMVHLVWSNPVLPAYEEVGYKRSSDGGVTWSSDTLLTNSPLMHSPISIALDPRGNPHICWYEYGFPYPGRLWYKNSSDGGLTWNPSMMIADSDTTLPGGPNIAVDGIGRVYLFFTAYCGSKLDSTWSLQIVYRVSKDMGQTFGPREPMTVYPDAPGLVSVTGDDKGGVHVAYPDTAPYGRDSNKLFYNGSTDGGVTWRYNPAFNLTDSFQGIIPLLTSDPTGRVHLVYRSGTNNPTYTSWIIYRSGYPLGVEENRQADKETRGQGEKLRATPNPFTSFVQTPGHETERFALYDITGRRVGTYKGDRIGEGLAAGVYFLRSDPPTLPSPIPNQVRDRLKGGGSKPLRIVKLR